MIRVRVSEDFAMLGVRVYVLLVGENEVPVSVLHGDSWDRLPEEPIEVEPTFRLRDNEARALLDGLTRHYQGAEDSRALRKDYDAERGRVDRLLEVVSTIATRP